MKNLIVASAFTFLSIGAFAQTNKMSGNDARFGVKAGVNLSSLKYSGENAGQLDQYSKNIVGFNVTAYGDFGVANNFFIQPGISLQNKGGKIEGNIFGGTGKIEQNVMAIEVPVNAVLRIPTGDVGAFQISAGPYAAFNISGKYKNSVTGSSSTISGDRDMNFGSKNSDDMSSMDFGANFGLGYRIASGFSIGANYGLGLSNLIPSNQKSNDNKVSNRVLGFTVGYSF
ncbi:porin family protein [Pedobacter sp.]|uniref:porin family protein n=1 Tax=Pedobacter sp. TaxID=1411316 RepID=UPI00396CF60D